MKSRGNNLGREIIYNKLREDIVYCRLRPGERLIEDDLINKYDISSRTPLREALTQLQAEGFVEYVPNKGAKVASLSDKEVYEIFSIRAVLEGYAAKLSAEQSTAGDIKKLKALQEKLERDGRSKNYPGWLENNTKFHFYIAEISKNKNLFNIIQQLQRRVFRYGYIVISIPGHIEKYISIHQKVIEALSKRDSNSSEKFMKKHLIDVRDILVGFLEKFPGF